MDAEKIESKLGKIKKICEKIKFLEHILNDEKTKPDKELNKFCRKKIWDYKVAVFFHGEHNEKKVSYFEGDHKLTDLDKRVSDAFNSDIRKTEEEVKKLIPDEKAANYLLGSFCSATSLSIEAFNYFSKSYLPESEIMADMNLYAKICEDAGERKKAQDIYNVIEKKSEEMNSKTTIFDKLNNQNNRKFPPPEIMPWYDKKEEESSHNFNIYYYTPEETDIEEDYNEDDGAEDDE